MWIFPFYVILLHSKEIILLFNQLLLFGSSAN